MKVKPIIVVKKGMIRLRDRQKIERGGYLLIEVDFMDQVNLLLPTAECLDIVTATAMRVLASENGIFGAGSKFGIELAKALCPKKEVA